MHCIFRIWCQMSKGYCFGALHCCTGHLFANARSLLRCNAQYHLDIMWNEQGLLHWCLRCSVKWVKALTFFWTNAWVKKLVQKCLIKFATWNIGTLTGKSIRGWHTPWFREWLILCAYKRLNGLEKKVKNIDTIDFKLWNMGKVKGNNREGIMVGIIRNKLWWM